MSIDPIYIVLTNPNLLKEITKWHIIEHLNNPKIIKILSNENNIEKFHSLLLDKYITLDDLDNLTSQYLTNKNIKYTMSFFEYTHYVNSPKLINYFINIIKYNNVNLQIDKNILSNVCNIPILKELCKKEDPTLGWFPMPIVTTTTEEKKFIEFYNILPNNNYFDINTNITNFQNNEDIRNIILKNVSYQHTNKITKNCFMCQQSIANEKHTKIINNMLYFLLKSQVLTLEYLKIHFEDIIPFVMYCGYNKPLKYIFKNYPNEIETINNHNIIQHNEIHNYLINTCAHVYYILMKNNIIDTHETFIKFILKSMEHGICRDHNGNLNYDNLTNTSDYYIKNYTKKIKNNTFQQLINLFKNNTYTNYDIQCLMEFINKNNSEIGNVKINYLSNKTIHLLSIIKNGDYINNLDEKDADDCYNFLFKYYDKSKSMITVALNKNIESPISSRLSILCKNKLYMEALNFIQEDTPPESHNNDTILTFEQYTNYGMKILNLPIYFEQIYENIDIPNKDDIFIDILNKYNIYPKFLIIIQAHTYNIFSDNILSQYILPGNTLSIIGDISINILNEKFNNFIITYSPLFTEEFKTLTPKNKNLCVNTLLHLNKTDILSKVITDKDITLDYNTKINIAIKYKLFDDAIALLFETNINLDVNIQPLLDHIHINQNNYDVIDIYIKIFKLILYPIDKPKEEIILTPEEIRRKALMEGIKTRDALNNNPPMNMVWNNNPQINFALNNGHQLIDINPQPPPPKPKYIPIMDTLELIHNLPKSLNTFCKLFPILCDLQMENNTTDLNNFINNYTLSQHLQYFESINSNNYIIKNVIIQNMLNNKKIPQTIPIEKTLTLTQNITKYNFKNIDTIIKNFVKHDHNLLVIMDSYNIKTNINLTKIPSQEIQKYLQKIQHCPGDQYIHDNFDLSLYDEWFLEYFTHHGLKKCLTKYLITHPTMKFDKNHVNAASKSKCLDILNKFKNNYRITTKHKRVLLNI